MRDGVGDRVRSSKACPACIEAGDVLRRRCYREAVDSLRGSANIEGKPPVERALIAGITGQDGNYLTEHHLSLGCEVHGVIRRASTFHTDQIGHLDRDPHDPATRLFLHYGDLTDGPGLRRILEATRSQEIYNLAKQERTLEDAGHHMAMQGLASG